MPLLPHPPRSPAGRLRSLLPLIAASSIALLLAGCIRTPQLGNEAAMGECEALYTAVTTKRADLLAACRKRLATLHSSGKLSDAAESQLTSVCEQCDRKEWRPAAERLYAFMRAQRK